MVQLLHTGLADFEKQQVLKKRVYVSTKETKFERVMLLACTSRYTTAVQTLNKQLGNSWKPFQLTDSKCCPIHIAAANGHAKIIQLLLDHGAIIDIQTEQVSF